MSISTIRYYKHDKSTTTSNKQARSHAYVYISYISNYKYHKCLHIHPELQFHERFSAEAIVFLDCHVRPMPNWTVALLAELSANPRRIAVPLITGLDPDTWEETSRDEGGRKMCLTWSVDFFWCNEYPGLEVPVLSGGLLAISRSWWLDSGGDLAVLVVEHSDTRRSKI